MEWRVLLENVSQFLYLTTLKPMDKLRGETITVPSKVLIYGEAW